MVWQTSKHLGACHSSQVGLLYVAYSACFEIPSFLTCTHFLSVLSQFACMQLEGKGVHVETKKGRVKTPNDAGTSPYVGVQQHAFSSLCTHMPAQKAALPLQWLNANPVNDHGQLAVTRLNPAADANNWLTQHTQQLSPTLVQSRGSKYCCHRDTLRTLR